MRTVLAVAVSLVAAAPASALVAPGRVVMPALGWEVEGNPDAGGGGPSLLLDDGSALVLADYDGHGRALHRLRRDGTVEQRGPLQLPDSVRALHAYDMFRDSQGRVLLVLSDLDRTRAHVVRLSAEGAVDPSYGSGGVASAALSVGDVAVAPDASVLVTGASGDDSGAPAPGEPRRQSWVVAKLDPQGRPDSSFGDGGIATLPTATARGSTVDVLGDGRVAVSGQEARRGGDARMLLGRLTAQGAMDPAWNGGRLVETPFTYADARFVAADGTVWMAGHRPRRPDQPETEYSPALLARYTAGGTADGEPRSLGLISPRRILPEPAGGLLVLAQPVGASGFATPIYGTVMWARAGADGSITPATQRVTPSFGGGETFGGGYPFTGLLAQNSFAWGAIHRRPDGSFLLVGGVSVAVYTGEGEGRSVGGHAYASLTPGFAPDTGFGGPARPPRARLSVPAQRLAAVRRTRRLRVRIDAERPSLAEVEVRSGGRLVALRTFGILRAGPATHAVPIRRSRIARLGPSPTIRLRVRDLVRTTRTVRARARLR